MNFGPIPPWRHLLRRVLAPDDMHWSDRVIQLLGPIALLIAIAGLVAGFCCPAIGADTHPVVYRLDQSRIVEVPAWIMRGILARETRSYYAADGSIVYVDRRIGAAGERGPWQMRRCAFAQVGLLNLRAEATRDPVCAEFCATVFLRWCYAQTGSWRQAIAVYHTGLDGDPADGLTYYRAVEAAGQRY